MRIKKLLMAIGEPLQHRVAKHSSTVVVMRVIIIAINSTINVYSTRTVIMPLPLPEFTWFMKSSLTTGLGLLHRVSILALTVKD